MSAKDKQRLSIAEVVVLPEWAKRSNLAIAKEFGFNPNLVGATRVAMGVMPEYVECKSRHGTMRLVKVSAIGKTRNKTPLTKDQQKMISDVIHIAEKLSRRKANNLIDEDQLLSIAQDHLMIAVKTWTPEKNRSWERYVEAGIRRAFRWAFDKRRKKLRRECLFGNHPYQRWYKGRQLEASFYEDTIEDWQENSVGAKMLARLEELSPMLREIGEALAGIGNEEPWSIEKIAQHWDLSVETARAYVDEVKHELASVANTTTQDE